MLKYYYVQSGNYNLAMLFRNFCTFYIFKINIKIKFKVHKIFCLQIVFNMIDIHTYDRLKPCLELLRLPNVFHIVFYTIQKVTGHKLYFTTIETL